MEAKLRTGLNKILKELDTAEKNGGRKKTEKNNFVCPVCEHTKYKAILQCSPLGGKIYPQEIECENCHIRLGIEAIHKE